MKVLAVHKTLDAGASMEGDENSVLSPPEPGRKVGGEDGKRENGLKNVCFQGFHNREELPPSKRERNQG